MSPIGGPFEAAVIVRCLFLDPWRFLPFVCCKPDVSDTGGAGGISVGGPEVGGIGGAFKSFVPIVGGGAAFNAVIVAPLPTMLLSTAIPFLFAACFFFHSAAFFFRSAARFCFSTFFFSINNLLSSASFNSIAVGCPGINCAISAFCDVGF